ncbi:AAA family ATPase [Lysinibacillus sp. NPDC056185]|uniref:AAA family ATPase n=1 Tax=Lysinibacillus sp. NPDC056185 TaxID=3345739 RepID=UPI0039F127CD
MLKYHFTNDTRVDNAESYLVSIANHIKNGIWHHQAFDLSGAKNGSYQVNELYMGLYKNSYNVELILNGKVKDVLAEFIKKFQFPNPRNVKKEEAMKLQWENNYQVAPLRQLVKLLFYKTMVEKSTSATITEEEFIRYILINEAVVKDEINLEENFTQLMDDTLAGHDLDGYEVIGGAEDRFISQLLEYLNKMPFIQIESKSKNITLKLDGISGDDKRLLMEIVSYNDFWTPINDKPKENEASYKEYMQVRPSQVASDLPVINDMNSEHNIIYYGAPGTGKSYAVTKKIKEYYPDFEDLNSIESQNIFRTTLHPEYTYSDFVGQIMPTIKEDGPSYEFMPGVFTLALKRAIELESGHHPVYLVLEELSRANVAAVFGDLFQLLDRKDGKSEYSISNPLIAKEIYGASTNKIFLPNNLFILSTVNTNDQNVFVMDTAFKRRFEWEYVNTRPTNLYNNPEIPISRGSGDRECISWHDFYQELNSYITKEMELGEDKQVGQFFIKFTDDFGRNKEKIKNKLLQYLWSDIHGTSFNGKKLFDDEIVSFSILYDRFENDQKVFNDDFLDNLSVNIKTDTKEVIDSIINENESDEN